MDGKGSSPSNTSSMWWMHCALRISSTRTALALLPTCFHNPWGTCRMSPTDVAPSFKSSHSQQQKFLQEGQRKRGSERERKEREGERKRE